jgi:hypothetical protein
MAIIRITKPPLRKTTAAKQARFRHLEVAKLQQPLGKLHNPTEAPRAWVSPSAANSSMLWCEVGPFTLENRE